MPPQTPPKKRTRRAARIVSNKTIEQLVALRAKLEKELKEVDTELYKAVKALGLSSTPKTSPNLPSVYTPNPYPQQRQPDTHEMSVDDGSTLVSPMSPEDQIAQLHNNISSKVDQLRHPASVPESSPF